MGTNEDHLCWCLKSADSTSRKKGVSTQCTKWVVKLSELVLVD